MGERRAASDESPRATAVHPPAVRPSPRHALGASPGRAAADDANEQYEQRRELCVASLPAFVVYLPRHLRFRMAWSAAAMSDWRRPLLRTIRVTAVVALLAWAGAAVIGGVDQLGLAPLLTCGTAFCIPPGAGFLFLLLLVSLLGTGVAVVLATLDALDAHRWTWSALLLPVAVGSAAVAWWIVSSNALAYDMRTQYGWDYTSWLHTSRVLFMALLALPPLLALASTMPRRGVGITG